jgi:hypothetical protein
LEDAYNPLLKKIDGSYLYFVGLENDLNHLIKEVFQNNHNLATVDENKLV